MPPRGPQPGRRAPDGPSTQPDYHGTPGYSGWVRFGNSEGGVFVSDLMKALGLRIRQPMEVQKLDFNESVNPGFKLKTLANLPEPIHVFATVEEAEAYYADSLPPGAAPHHFVYRGDFVKRTVKADVNELWVVGYDPSSGQPLKAWYADEKSQDPQALRSTWEDNHWGEALIGAFYSTNIQSMTACLRTLKTLIPRSCYPRHFASMEGDFMRFEDRHPVWGDDLLAVHGHGYYRILSYDADVISVPSERWLEGEWNGETDPTQEIAAHYQLERLYEWPPEEE